MAITLTTNFLNELKKNVNIVNTILELESGDLLLLYSSLEEVSTTSETWVKLKEIQVEEKRIYRIKFKLRTSDANYPSSGVIRKNGVEVGTQQTTASTSYVEYSEDIAGWVAGDLLQIYGKVYSGGTCYIKDLEVYISKIKWGMHSGGFNDVQPILKSVGSLQNKIDARMGYSTRGQIIFTIEGRDNFKDLIKNNYLKNRRVVIKTGFITSGFLYSDYAQIFTGKIINWDRKGDLLTIAIGDDLDIVAKKKIPTENVTKTQYINYQNTNPVDIMLDILQNKLGISSSSIDTAKFNSEKSDWLLGWKFERVLTKPEEGNKYLNELQAETNSFIIHDGEKISFKFFGPPLPGVTIEEWTDNYQILHDSLDQESGYKDGFYNRIVFYYDYDESGNNKSENYESAVITIDSASQDPSQWDEIKSKEIKSKWIRSLTYTQPINVTGVVIYHCNRINNSGNGTLTYNYTDNTLTWTSPGDTAGETIKLSKDGAYQVFSNDKTKYVRILVTLANLPTQNKSDTITITAIPGSNYVNFLSQKLLNRYRDPVASVGLQVDINNVAWESKFIKPVDMKDFTTDEANDKKNITWNKERMLITSVRPDFSKSVVNVEAIQTKMYKRYGFICPAGFPDYPSASSGQRTYAFMGDTNNKVNAGTEDGYYIW